MGGILLSKWIINQLVTVSIQFFEHKIDAILYAFLLPIRSFYRNTPKHRFPSLDPHPQNAVNRRPRHFPLLWFDRSYFDTQVGYDRTIVLLRSGE